MDGERFFHGAGQGSPTAGQGSFIQLIEIIQQRKSWFALHNSEFSQIYPTFIIVVQCCHILLLWVSWIEKIRQCEPYFAAPLLPSFYHFCRVGLSGAGRVFHREGNPPSPRDRASIPVIIINILIITANAHWARICRSSSQGVTFLQEMESRWKNNLWSLVTQELMVSGFFLKYFFRSFTPPFLSQDFFHFLLSMKLPWMTTNQALQMI